MIGPNLSEWAIQRRSLIVYFMIAAIIAGTISFLRLGRDEDPVFTFRTMIVFAAWPGATIEETLLQVTERHRAQAPGDAQSRPRAQLHDRRRHDHLRRPQAVDAARRGARTSGTRCARTSATSATPCRRASIGPGFNDDFGDTFGIIYGFTADGFTPPRAARLRRGRALAAAAVPDVSKIEILGAQDERIFLEFSTARLAGLGLTYSALLGAAAGAEPGAARRACCRPATSGSSCASPARSTPRTTSRRSTSSSASGSCRCATSRRCAAASRTRRSRCSASTASPRSGSRSRCATAATSSRSART